jgi:glycosyltransferase involved in cell wall biosynthesis
MKVAIVWNHPSRLLDGSFRFEQYLAGFRALGHEPVLVCARESAAGVEAPFHLADDAAELRAPGFWREVAADVAVIVSWHRMSDVLEAIGEAGTRVAAIADSDGRVGVRVFPGFALMRLLAYGDGFRDRARRLKYGLGRFVSELVTPSEEDAEALRSTRASDVLALGHAEGLRLFRRFLAHHGEGEALGSRLVEVPFTLGASFFSCPVPETKDDLVVAVGRWNDPQKNAPLLARALALFVEARPRTSVVIFGAGGERVFAPLGGRVEYRGVARQEVVAETLSRARSIVFASRWEGCPHAATEALALGATVVGTPIPSLASWTADGRFGRVARRPRARSLARALVRELRAWDAGERHGPTIAGWWRPRLSPEGVCGRLLAPLAPGRTSEL